MNAIFALAVGALVAIGVYQVLGKDLLRIAFGIYVIFNGVNLLIMAIGTGAATTQRAPFVQLGGPFAEPMLQAMVLTAIVIGFGLATFLLLLAARLGQAHASLDAEQMTEWRQ
ncbi:Na(+)/H(+) antiporter subunit C [compost metagenome]